MYFCIVVQTTINNAMIKDKEIFDILTGKVSGLINRTLLRAFALKSIDITTEQWSVLSCLWEKDKVTQQMLCNLTHKDKPSMTRLIDKLEKNGFVVRVSDASDRRINLIHLTEKGAKIRIKAIDIVQEIVKKALNGIGSKDLEKSRNVLIQIMRNLES